MSTASKGRGCGHGASLYIRPSFMMTLKFLAGLAISLMLAKGLPSTRSKSASAPYSTMPSFPAYGLRLPDHASSSALALAAVASASAGPYQRTSEARIAPCCCASAWENRTSLPHVVLNAAAILSYPTSWACLNWVTSVVWRLRRRLPLLPRTPTFNCAAASAATGH